MSRPCYTLLTFNDQEAYINLTKKQEIEILDEKLVFNQALHPENMQWENREVEPVDRYIRLTVVVTAILVIAVIYYILLDYGMTATMWFSFMNYPSGINCDLYNELASQETLKMRAASQVIYLRESYDLYWDRLTEG